MKQIWYHQPQVTNILKGVAFTLQHMSNELVRATDNDVHQVDTDDGSHLP